MYQHGLGVLFFVKRAEKTAYWVYAAPAGFRTFDQAWGEFFQSLAYSHTLSQQSFGGFLEFVLPTFMEEDELRA